MVFRNAWYIKKRPADLSIVKRLGGFLRCKISANRMNLQISKDKMHKKFIFSSFRVKFLYRIFVA